MEHLLNNCQSSKVQNNIYNRSWAGNWKLYENTARHNLGCKSLTMEGEGQNNLTV